MNAQQLKNAILQEAIEGRLVPQDPNDEPASALLAHIRKEKERLVREGKLKKKDLEVKPISEDEIPFEIPESWEWCRVSDIIFPPKYGTSNKSLTNGDIPVLRMGNIQDGEIVFDKLVYSNDILDNDKYNLINGDLLFNRTNSADLVGKTAIYRGQRPAIYAGYLILLRPICICSDYLNFVLGSSYARSYCKEVKTIGVQQCNINAEKISTFIIPLPPLAEQKRIVAKIEELLPKVEKYGKAQDELNKLNEELPERLKKSILQEAIEGRLVPQDPKDEPASVLLAKIRKEKEQLVKEGKLKKKDLIETPISDDEIPFEIPESWEWCNLFDCVDILYGYPFDSTAFNENSLGFPLIRIRDIIPSSTKTYTTEKAEERYVIKKGDMLVGMDGNFNVCFWKSDNAYLNQRVCKITAKESILNQKYLYYYLPYELEEIFKTVSYVTVKHLSDKHFRTMRIPLPPLAEQKRIVAKLEQLLGEIDKLKK